MNDAGSDDPRERDGTPEASRIVRDARDAGDGSIALDRVYGELRKLARGYLERERAGHTLQPTALVHEAWLRVADDRSAWKGRAHFLATCAVAMRRILVDHGRARGRLKRGSGRERVTFDRLDLAADDQVLDPVELDQALQQLHEHSPRQAKVVELRFFAGMTVEEVAEFMELSESTIASEWRFARAWLSRALRGDDG